MKNFFAGYVHLENIQKFEILPKRVLKGSLQRLELGCQLEISTIKNKPDDTSMAIIFLNYLSIYSTLYELWSRTLEILWAQF